MSDRYVPLAEVRQILSELKDVRPETSFGVFQDSTLTLAQGVPISLDDANKLAAELKTLHLVTSEGKEYKPSDSVTYKIVDLLPTTSIEVRSIISREHIVLSETSLKEILGAVSKYN